MSAFTAKMHQKTFGGRREGRERGREGGREGERGGRGKGPQVKFDKSSTDY